MKKHNILDNKVHIYKRENSRYWQCSTYMRGQNHRVSTKEENLSLAKEFAREWYMAVYVEKQKMERHSRMDNLIMRFRGKNNQSSSPYPSPDTPEVFRNSQGKQRLNKNYKTFAQAADKFVAEYSLSVVGHRNEEYVKSHEQRIRVHLLPFFQKMRLTDINSGIVQEYRIQRMKNGYKGIIPSRSTLHHETVTLRMVLKTAHRYGWLDAIPDISAPYKTSGKIKHRA